MATASRLNALNSWSPVFVRQDRCGGKCRLHRSAPRRLPGFTAEAAKRRRMPDESHTPADSFQRIETKQLAAE
jgi:hypothetical protein